MAGTRLFLFPCLALAVSACAPSDEGKEQRAPAIPGGFELAAAQERAGGAAQTPSVIDLTSDQLKEKLASGNVRLIDVRTDEEVAQGTIPGAEHIALDRFDPALLGADDGREIVLYCRSDRRSGIAAQALADHTGQPAQHLSGGILGWQDAGEPVE